MVGEIETSFERTYAKTVVFSAPTPQQASRLMPLPETPGHSQTSVAQSLVGSLLLSPGSWCTQGFVYALQECLLLCHLGTLVGEARMLEQVAIPFSRGSSKPKVNPSLP